MTLRCLIVLPVMSLAVAASARAQSPVAAPQESTTTLSATAGLSAASSMAATAGAALTYDISRRLTVEISGGYFGGNMGSGASASTLSAGLLVDLTGPGKTVPYVTVGGGLYRASFDMDNRSMFGGLGMAPGMQLVPLPGGMGFGMMQGYSGSMWQGTWTGPTAVPAGMPQFYSMRLGTMMASSDGRLGMRRFTDPMVSAGAGVTIRVSDRLTLRPDVRSLLVVGGGDTYMVTVFSVGLGYRF